MHHSRILTAFAFVSVAILAAPTYVMSQNTADKMEQKARSAAREVKTEVTDSWLTAKTKIALYSDERVKGRQISVETVKGTVMLRGKVDSDEARAAAASIAGGVEHVKAVKNDLQVVAVGDRKTTDISDKDITTQVGALSRRSMSGPMRVWSLSRVPRPASGPAPGPPNWPVACPVFAPSRTS